MRKFNKVFLFLTALPFVAACTMSGNQESTGEYIDGSISTTKIKAQLLDNLGQKAIPIKVKVLKEEVQLSGFVSSDTVKRQAGIIARDNPEIKKVYNNLIVK